MRDCPPPAVEREESWHGVFRRIIDDTHVATADDLSDVVDRAVAKLGLMVQLYLTDLPQRRLHPVRAETGPSQVIDSTTAGRAYRTVEIVPGRPFLGRSCLWLPMLNGAERLGVAHVVLPEGADPNHPVVRQQCWTLAGVLGHLVMSKLHYSDLFHVVRRTRPLTVAAELLWQMLPPQTFASDRLAVAALLEPYDEVGGDGYDYAVDDHRAYVAIFDSMGHDMLAGLTTAVALAATRNARRQGLGLLEAAGLADRSIHVQSSRASRMPFATAVLAELDLDTGQLCYLVAGHPPPVLLRRGRVVKTLHGYLRPPLGLGHLVDEEPKLGREQLQPGDRVLFHSDGVIEARSPDGELFGVERLVDLTERNEAAGLPPPETLRRVGHAVLEHQDGRLQDDATLVLLEWSDGVRTRLPQV
ncbi:PP2C family protein-serine/threonine phosphatase [Saccharothrix coeruleofusca]|uniref:PPM-type phosphatase domain-containing protein n=1 Tax=Saccharothrix coeruleofusca TaxID=33919 RepID=A0A918EHL1_9PSEU|nr:PP2C family protein-serine/threonine phosphatase [Saccharothrix coeruleofusca]MBP2336808.1 hypothetical protein [Saccharothrix coeruleofusca]GGP82713.1 hypothetical protein GCM10010185_65940 [Saccharothrix coeruleofusca]